LTAATHVGEPVLRGDTVDIPVHYEVLGRAFLMMMNTGTSRPSV